MRKSREELLFDFPSWNEEKHDIVKVMYGDIPLIHYDEEEYKKFLDLPAGTLQNICATEAYIYTQNGTYDEYRTEIGTVRIAENGNVLCGEVKVKYRGMYHDVHLNLMYGWKALDVLRLSGSGKVLGFSNKDGIGSPTKYTEEMKPELIERILNDPLKDYGYAMQKFMQTARELYAEDTTNYVMSKRFGC